MEIESWPLDKARPYPANARKIPQRAVEQCAESIREFGWQQPIVVDRDGVIVAGHVRHRAAALLGETTIPVVVARELSDAQIRAYRIADNRTRDYTTWDYGMLADELRAVGDDFAKVLDLADWQQLVAEFERQRADAEDLLSGDARALISQEHAVTVVFADRDSADRAGPELLAIAGVLHVRYPR